MIYRDRKTGLLYRWLLASFNVKTQKHEEVYMQMETGAIFNRESDDFAERFARIVENPQLHIVPKVNRGEENRINDEF